MAALPILAAAFTTSCSDQDFDWDKAHGQNVEANYEQRFDKLFGAIDPNQNWDFTEQEEVTGMPVSITLEDGTVITPNYDAVPFSTRAGEYWNAKLKNEWYNIPSATITWFKNNLKEGVNHKSTGKSFLMYVPEGKFSVTPMYQGQHGMDWNLKIQFIEPDGTSHYAYYGNYSEYVWKNGDLLQYKTSDKGSWKTLSGHDNTLEATAIQGKTLYFENVPAGTVVVFDLYIAKGSGNYASTGTHQLSTNNMMLAYNLTGNALPTTMPIDYGVNNNMMIMGVEDANGSGSDWDYNDVVFLVNGLIKQSVTDETVPVTRTVRYMVEDMGYSDKNSIAVQNGYTDIDFNDIVVDFSRTINTKYEYKNGVLDKVTEVSRSYAAKVRALGGTWDFRLKVAGVTVFQKSAANTYINYNPNYKIDNTPISSIVVGRIYNTRSGSDMRGDGNYNTTYYPQAADDDASNTWIGTLKNTNNCLNKWDPDNHNLVTFEIVDGTITDADFLSITDRKNVYSIEWPTMGACPKIAAFKPTKTWQSERTAVSKEFFSTSSTWQ